MKTAKVTYSNGDVITTSINGTNEEIKAYFAIGKTFNIGSGENDNMQKVAACEILPDKKLPKKTIPHQYFNQLLSGHTVPREESRGEVIPFKVGKEYTIIDQETKNEVRARCTQDCPYALILIKD